ncbi:large subunit GTPase 1 homolog [Saccoglossus kowalevskii]|uniref:Large subunit GTPase 1 homolog n=1 Tax=Saccoglossus kowalevskii TaxID=10224 RepID=A0ABM0GU36_SACKO|nr:PREDICTED: large subunit GTPase 1 homolog [Saccoglossus kowalevskii]
MGKKNKNASGLGQSVIKDRFRVKSKRQGNADTWLHTSDLQDGYDWGRLNLQSVTEQSTLDEFLAIADLAGTEFTAERLNVKVVDPSKDTGLPSIEEVSAIKDAQLQNKDFLKIPRRPAWDATTTPQQLELLERDSFLEWRRQLNVLQEKEHIVLTPFERNLDFWRQLWRVIERSDVIVQIVDGRNPLLFRCEDMEKYVKEVDENKDNLVLINKADLLNENQRKSWADYFTKIGVKVVFWSAVEEAERQKQMKEEADAEDNEEEEDEDEEEEEEESNSDDDDSDDKYDNKDTTNKDTDQSESVALDETMTTGVSKTYTTEEKSSDHCECHETDKVEEEGEKSPEKSDDKMLRCEEDKTADVEHDDCCHGGTAADEKEKLSVDTETRTSEMPTQDTGSAGNDSDGSVGCGEHDQKKVSLSDNGSEVVSSQESCSEEIANSARILNGDELLELFKSMHQGPKANKNMVTIGLVGYPNVGKSSTINALLQCKKVPVSATPGRTKHFQTLFVEPSLCLCDCPGLVMPSFVSTKAEMVVNGILPIDQMRQHLPPVSLISLYDVRGFMTAHGVPDAPRSSRYILKDYVKGKLLYRCAPPGVDEKKFQEFPQLEITDDAVSKKKVSNPTVVSAEGIRKKNTDLSEMDSAFFSQQNVRACTKGVQGVMGYVRKDADCSRHVSSDSRNSSPQSSQSSVAGKPWKKHFNKNKKEKLRRVNRHLDEC